MIQRTIYRVLKRGLDLIEDDPKILDDIFGPCGYELGAEEIAAIKELFVDKPPGVHHGYARQDHDFPLFAIILAGEQEDQHFVGNDAGMVDDPEHPDFGSDILSTIWDHTYHVLCYAEHPDVTTYIYEVAKAVLFTGEDDFQNASVFQLQVSGMDLAPDPRYIPENLFVRQLTLNCKREYLRVDRESKLGKAWKVGGIHVDKTGSSGDVGGVNTNVIISGSSEGEADG